VLFYVYPYDLNYNHYIDRYLIPDSLNLRIEGDFSGSFTSTRQGRALHCQFNPQRTGQGVIRAIYRVGGYEIQTVSGLVRILAGQLNTLRITLNEDTIRIVNITTDDTVRFKFKGWDQDNNVISQDTLRARYRPLVTWDFTDLPDNQNSISILPDSSLQFTPTQPGINDTLRLRVNNINAIPIQLNISVGRPRRLFIAGWGGVELGDTSVTPDDSLRLLLRGYDSENNFIANIVGNWRATPFNLGTFNTPFEDSVWFCRSMGRY